MPIDSPDLSVVGFDNGHVSEPIPIDSQMNHSVAAAPFAPLLTRELRTRRVFMPGL